MTRYNIQPVNAFPAQATQIDITDVRVTLSSTADCQYFLVDADGNQVSPASRCALTEAQYAAWGNDDEVFVNAIISNLGLTRQ